MESHTGVSIIQKHPCIVYLIFTQQVPLSSPSRYPYLHPAGYPYLTGLKGLAAAWLRDIVLKLIAAWLDAAAVCSGEVPDEGLMLHCHLALVSRMHGSIMMTLRAVG